MKMQTPFETTLCDLNVLQDLGLQRGSKPFGLFDAILARRLFQFGQGANAEVVVKPEDLIGTQTWHGKQL